MVHLSRSRPGTKTGVIVGGAVGGVIVVVAIIIMLLCSRRKKRVRTRGDANFIDPSPPEQRLMQSTSASQLAAMNPSVTHTSLLSPNRLTPGISPDGTIPQRRPRQPARVLHRHSLNLPAPAIDSVMGGMYQPEVDKEMQNRESLSIQEDPRHQPPSTPPSAPLVILRSEADLLAEVRELREELAQFRRNSHVSMTSSSLPTGVPSSSGEQEGLPPRYTTYQE